LLTTKMGGIWNRPFKAGPARTGVQGLADLRSGRPLEAN
jgi:hypothetical protein